MAGEDEAKFLNFFGSFGFNFYEIEKNVAAERDYRVTAFGGVHRAKCERGKHSRRKSADVVGSMRPTVVYLVPFSANGLQDRLFAEFENPNANVPPLWHLREYFSRRGVDVHTIDFWDGRRAEALVVFDHPPTGFYALAYSVAKFLGKKSGWAVSHSELKKILKSFARKALFKWESPVNEPWMYMNERKMHNLYDAVYAVPQSVGAERFYYPQRIEGWSREYFEKPRANFLVMINGMHTAKGFFDKELYSERERVAKFFGKFGEIDVYGSGWQEHKVVALRRAAKGFVYNKPETLSGYTFAICFENAMWPDYVTEKIFDCLHVGTVPVYLGATNIEEYVPRDCFVDVRNFKDYGALREFLSSLPRSELERYRAAAKKFLESADFRKFGKEHFAETVWESVFGKQP